MCNQANVLVASPTTATAVLLAAFKALVNSLLLSSAAVLGLAFTWQSTPLSNWSLSSWDAHIFAQPVSHTVSTDSLLLLLPLFLLFAGLSLYSLWLTSSHLVATLALAAFHRGRSVNLQRLSELRFLAPTAKAFLQKALTTTALVSSLAVSPVLVTAATAADNGAADLRWGSETPVSNQVSAPAPLSPLPLMSPTAHQSGTTIPVNLPTEDPQATAASDTSASGTSISGTSAAVHEVIAGDCLWNIAKAHLKTEDLNLINDYWQAIWEANRSVIGADPNLIHPGQILTLPALQPK